MVLHHKPICQRNDMYAICHKSVFLQAGCIYHKTNKSLFWYKKVVPVEHLVMLVYLIPSLHPTAKSLVIFFCLSHNTKSFLLGMSILSDFPRQTARQVQYNQTKLHSSKFQSLDQKKNFSYRKKASENGHILKQWHFQKPHYQSHF